MSNTARARNDGLQSRREHDGTHRRRRGNDPLRADEVSERGGIRGRPRFDRAGGAGGDARFGSRRDHSRLPPAGLRQSGDHSGAQVHRRGMSHHHAHGPWLDRSGRRSDQGGGGAVHHQAGGAGRAAAARGSRDGQSPDAQARRGRARQAGQPRSSVPPWPAPAATSPFGHWSAAPSTS